MSGGGWIREHPWRFLAGMVLLVAGIAYLADWLVVTDEEAIVEVLHDARDAYVAGDWDGVFRDVAEDFRAPGGRNREAFRAQVMRRSRATEVQSVSLSISPFEVQEGQPTPVELVATIWSTGARGMEWTRVRLRLKLERRQERWWIVSCSDPELTR